MNLADLYESMGRYQEGAAAAGKGALIYEQCFGENEEDTASAFCRQGEVFMCLICSPASCEGV